MPFWDNTNPCDESFDIADDAEITTSIHITKESTYASLKFDSQHPVIVAISMSHDDDEPWFHAQEDFDLWYDTSETMDDYNEWDKPPNIHEDISISNESPNKHIEPDFYISECQT